MQLSEIFARFKQLETSSEKVEFLRWLQKQNYGYAMNFDRLIEYWSGH